MKKVSGIFCALAVISHSASISAYEIDTHEQLSIEAYSISNLQTDPDIQVNLGLVASDKFPGSDGVPKSISQLIGDGAKFEDNLSLYRPINHFFDPLTGNGLSGIVSLANYPSPDWALEDKGAIDGVLGIGKQEFSYRDARQYFYDALTQTEKTKREENFGKTFQTLGHVIHHIQDMAQPQHVRNDAHLDLPLDDIPDIPGIENPSRYEKYTDENRSKLVMAGYSPVSLSNPRQFWITGGGTGLAEYTNSNFVSAGTNFRLLDGVAAPGRYVEPTPLAETAEPIEPLFAAKGLPIPPECAAPNPPCTMSFFSSLVWDKYLNKSDVNLRAAGVADYFFRGSILWSHA